MSRHASRFSEFGASGRQVVQADKALQPGPSLSVLQPVDDAELGRSITSGCAGTGFHEHPFRFARRQGPSSPASRTCLGGAT